MIDAEFQSTAMDRLNATFEEYAKVNRRDLEDLVAKKGRDLGIKLYQGYRGVRERRGYAVRELRARSRLGAGTRVRTQVLESKWTKKIPRVFPARGRTRRSLRRTGYGRGLTRQQLLVGQEILKREAGRGRLAASFLWFRRRSSQARGIYLVKNRVARVLGQADVAADSFRIRGYGPGLAVIDARRGIVRGAIARSEADMRSYIERKQREAVQKTFPPRISA